MKKEKEPTLKQGKWNELKGSDLIDMGYIKTTDGYLIANKLLYKVWLKLPKWDIFLAEKKLATNK